MHKITILYKSGQKVHLKAKKFHVEWDPNTNTVSNIAWEDPEPQPLMLGIKNVEAVWKGHV